MPTPETILSGWVQRDQQVFVAETLVTLAATIYHKSQLAHRDVIWFVDNLGPLSVLVKGNSSQFDAGVVTATAHLLWSRLNMRVWLEWVASDDNCSDGLSRNGLADEWTLQQKPAWECVELTPPSWFKLLRLPQVDVSVALQSFEGC